MKKFTYFVTKNKSFALFITVLLSRIFGAPFLFLIPGKGFFTGAVTNVCCIIIELFLILFYKSIPKLLSLTILLTELTVFCVIQAAATGIVCGMDYCVISCIPALFLFSSEKKHPVALKAYIYPFFLCAFTYITYIKLAKISPSQLNLPAHRYYIICSEVFFTFFCLFTLLYGSLITDSEFRRLAKKREWFLKETDYIVKHDTLTGLMNRRRSHQIFNALSKAKKTDNIDYAIAIFDIDNFKKINDTWGHDAGDFILKSFTKSVWDQIKEPAKIGRWGGEEFIIIFPEIDEETVYKLENIRLKAIQTPIEYNGQDIQVTATFGIASSRKYDSPEAVLAQADAMLLIGKQNGKNRIVVSQDF